jgi:hypothetical protein
MALVLVMGCSSQRVADAKKPGIAYQRAGIEARALRVFTNAVLVKPREDIPATNPALSLAPLLIEEATGSAGGTNQSPATIYYQLGVVQVGGMTHLQMTYLWPCGREESSWLGIRLTLNSQGLPVIWEVLSDRPGPRVVFVSESLEEKAKQAFGLPAPGRHFSVEQPLKVAPEVVVARVIEDGPMAMGPIVHVTAKPCAVSTVICRCMPTQARQLVGTSYYELKPPSDAVKSELQMLEPGRTVDEELRLPPGF